MIKTCSWSESQRLISTLDSYAECTFNSFMDVLLPRPLSLLRRMLEISHDFSQYRRTTNRAFTAHSLHAHYVSLLCFHCYYFLTIISFSYALNSFISEVNGQVAMNTRRVCRLYPTTILLATSCLCIPSRTSHFPFPVFGDGRTTLNLQTSLLCISDDTGGLDFAWYCCKSATISLEFQQWLMQLRYVDCGIINIRCVSECLGHIAKPPTYHCAPLMFHSIYSRYECFIHALLMLYLFRS